MLVAEPVTLHASFDTLWSFFRRHRSLVLGVALVVAAGVTLVSLLRARTYTATASFMSQSTRAGSNLGGIAAQFGVSLPGDQGGDSPQFYADLITSREILDSVVVPAYVVPTSGGRQQVSLAGEYDVRERDPAKRRDRTMRKLREHLAVTIGKQTGVVNLSVTTTNPYLSQAVAARILAQINAFNLRKRQTRASAEREFTEARLTAARSDLQNAEDRLQAFMQENRQYMAAPHLSFEYDRLSREVATRQALVTTLTQAFEQAKIEEVRDTPVITVLDSPEVPPNPDPRGLVTAIVFSLLLGALAGAGLAWIRERRLHRA